MTKLGSPADRIVLSTEVSGKSEDVAETHAERLRKRTLTPLVYFYIGSNAVLNIGVFVFAMLERRHPSFGAHIITEGVVTALIAGNTVQISAMIIAAFRGLFDSKPAKTKRSKKPGGSP